MVRFGEQTHSGPFTTSRNVNVCRVHVVRPHRAEFVSKPLANTHEVARVLRVPYWARSKTIRVSDFVGL